MKKPIISFDLNSLPPGMTIKEWHDAFEKTGILLYDSDFGKKPEILLNEEPKNIEIKEVKFGIPKTKSHDEDT